MSYPLSSYSSVNLAEPEDSLRQRQFQKPRPPLAPTANHTMVGQGIGLWTPLWIIGGTVAAATLAVAHHLVDTHFNDQPVDGQGFWTQNRTKSLEIVLAGAFKILFCFSAGVSLCQMAWHAMRRKPLLLADIDCLVAGPSLVMLPRINLIYQAPATLAITVIILASPLLTVFAPSLTVRQASAVNRTITVPTLDLASDAWLDDMILDGGGEAYLGPSGTWDKVVLQGLMSSGPVGWTIPDGCAPECRYNFTYAAPAIRCSDLAPDQINDGGHSPSPRTFQDPSAAYLMYYDADPTNGLLTGIVNFTAQGLRNAEDLASDHFVWTVAYFPFSASNAEDGAVINAAGSICTFHNATHEAQTHFVNGTQQSTVSVVEFNEALNTSMRRPSQDHVFNAGGTGRFSPGLGAPLHSFAFADAITARLLGAIVRFADGPIVPFGDGTGTLLLETNLFQSPGFFNLSTPQFPGVNVSSSVTNMSLALENLVANISLSFVQMATAFTTVDALVSSTHTVYHYNHTTLAATYFAALGCLVLISILGLYCLITNGQPSSHSFSQLLIATRNPALDYIADTAQANPRVPVRYAADARLMFGEVEVPGRGVQAAFGVVSHQDVQMLRRRTLP
ncbi:hypothetical protein FB451DRAFT_1304183 [Mycena latifolia]|nr:hypothetical protein FB451DRAFT_1304183 [Mycena latifolia]